MKKTFLTIAAALLFAGSAFAANEIVPETTIEQEESTVIASKFAKNWEMTAAVGTQIFLSEYVGQFKFADMWDVPTIDFGMQKWASPIIAIGFDFNVSKLLSLYGKGDKQATFRQDTKDIPYGNTGLMLAAGWTGNFFVKGTLNLTNLFCGYRPDRVFEMLAYLGGGVIFPMSVTKYFTVNGSFNAGLTGRFNVGKHFGIDVNVRGALLGDNINGISYQTSGDKKNVPFDANLGATLGLTWKFGYPKNNGQKKEWVSLAEAASTSTTLANAVKEAETAAAAKIAADLAAANAKVAAQQGEIDALKAEAAKPKAAQKPIIIWQLSNFKIESATLTNREKVGLKAAADVIKQQPDQIFVITGYADKKTGSAKYNQKLSQKRAEAVYAALVNEFGVDTKQLRVDSKGGVDNMFYNDPQCSRSVIISTLEK